MEDIDKFIAALVHLEDNIKDNDLLMKQADHNINVLLHQLEFMPVDAVKLMQIGKRLKENRLIRRECKNKGRYYTSIRTKVKPGSVIINSMKEVKKKEIEDMDRYKNTTSDYVNKLDNVV